MTRKTASGTAYLLKTYNGETTMLKVFAAAALLVAIASPAMADTKNLDKAVADAISTYRKGGSDALVSTSKICSSGIDPVNGSRDMMPGEQAEYCFAFEVASLTIIGKPGVHPPQDTAYFVPNDVAVRAVYNLERTRVISLPEQVNPYVMPRINYVKAATQKAM